MKLKNFLFEATEVEIKAYFEVHGKLDLSNPDGVSVNGDVLNSSKKVKEWDKLASVPIKFLTVTGEFSLDMTSIKNVENFPNEAHRITIYGAPRLQSLVGLEKTVIHDSLIIEEAPLQTLEGCPLGAQHYSFRDNNSLKSTKGFPAHRPFEKLNLEGCTKLSNITNLLDPTNTPGEIVIDYNKSLPLVKLVLVNGLNGYHKFKILKLDRQIEKICNEYMGKGLGNTIELTQKLRDQHMENSSNFRFT